MLLGKSLLCEFFFLSLLCNQIFEALILTEMALIYRQKSCIFSCWLLSTCKLRKQPYCRLLLLGNLYQPIFSKNLVVPVFNLQGPVPRNRHKSNFLTIPLKHVLEN